MRETGGSFRIKKAKYFDAVKKIGFAKVCFLQNYLKL